MSAGSIVRSGPRTIVIAAGMMLALVSGGCTNSNAAAPERESEAVASMDDLRQEALSARWDVDKTMETLNELPTSTTDLRATYDKFSSQVDEIKSDAAKIKQLTADLQNRVDEYVKKWQEDMSKVTDPSMKQLSEQRRDAVQKRMAEVRTAHKGLANTYSAFYDDLVSIRTYLGNDLTPAGVKAVEPKIKKANEDRAAMKPYGDELLKVLDQISAGMATPPPSSI